MTPETGNLLRHSACTRAVLALLRQVGLSVPGLAHVLGDRHPASTIRRSVLELRRIGLVAWTGKWVAAPLWGCGRAKVWKAKDQ